MLLRFVTYLAPSIPGALFELIAAELGAALGVATTLTFETAMSGPVAGDDDPFAAGRFDVAFLCAPSLLWLLARTPPSVSLVPTAMLFDDPRLDGRPAYFSDVVVRAGSPVTRFADLEGSVLAYNDPSSLSGTMSVARALHDLGRPASFFRATRRSGSHLASLAMVASGEADVAAIDSNALRFVERERPELARGLRVLVSWGPYPVQPVVARRGLEPGVVRALGESLLALANSPEAARRLLALGVRGFAAVDGAVYDADRAALAACAPIARALVAPPGGAVRAAAEA